MNDVPFDTVATTTILVDEVCDELGNFVVDTTELNSNDSIGRNANGVSVVLDEGAEVGEGFGGGGFESDEVKVSRIGEPGTELSDVGEVCARMDMVDAVDRTVNETDGFEEAGEDEMPRLASELLDPAPFATLIMSAAWKYIRSFHGDIEGNHQPTFSAIPYTIACKCPAGIIGMIEASTMRRFCVP